MSKNSYSQIFKSTSILGGSQIFKIVIGLIRSKFVAVFLGTTGYGINGLLLAPLSLITSISSLGIGFSAVRDISIAHENDDHYKLSKSLFVLRRWVWITGILGMFCTVLISSWLSKWIFGTDEYQWAFIWLSITVLLNSVSEGHYSALRGTRRIYKSAKASMYGSAVGLISSLPLYYFLGLNGIVPALIISALSTLIIYWVFTRGISTSKISLTYKETFLEGREMAKLGIVMILSSLSMQLVSNLVNIFIARFGSLSEVGLYNAGWSITNQYVDLVFTAMWADFYPLLAGISHDKNKIDEAVNQQSEIAVLIIGPLMIFYLISLPILIPIFYTIEFLPILDFTQWIVLGMLFKALSGSMGMIIIAKGESKLFLISELFISILTLIFNIFSYYVWGLKGMGISFTTAYFIYFLFIYFLVKTKFDYKISKTLIKIGVWQFFYLIIAFINSYWLNSFYPYYIGSMVLLISGTHALYEINKRIKIKPLLENLLNSKKN